MADRSDETLLTIQDVQGWKDRKAELERQIADAQKELTEINRNLEAAAVLQSRKGSTGPATAAETAPVDELEEDDGFGSPVAG